MKTDTRFQLHDRVDHNGRPAQIAGVYPDVKGSVRYHIAYLDTHLGDEPDAAFFLLGRVLSPLKHTFSAELDRCRCGGEWVYFEGETLGYGYGCAVDGKPSDPPVDGHGRPIVEG